MPPQEPPLLGDPVRCEACGAWHRPSPSCVCGHLLVLHNIETKRRPCSTWGCGCTMFREAEAHLPADS